MSTIYSDIDLALAFNKGHNDGWAGNPPKQSPAGNPMDQEYQSYRSGYSAGTAAKYYYSAGYIAGATTIKKI